MNGKLHAKFPLLKAELEVFFKDDGLIDGKERVIRGEITEQMKNFVKKLDLNFN